MDKEKHVEMHQFLFDTLEIDSNKNMDNKESHDIVSDSQEKVLSLIVRGMKSKRDRTNKKRQGSISINDKIVKDQLNSMQRSARHNVKKEPKYFDSEETYLKRSFVDDYSKEKVDEKAEKEMTEGNVKKYFYENGENEISTVGMKYDEKYGNKEKKEIENVIIEMNKSEEVDDIEMKYSREVIGRDCDNGVSIITDNIDESNESNFVQKEELEGSEKDESQDSGLHSAETEDILYMSSEIKKDESRDSDLHSSESVDSAFMSSKMGDERKSCLLPNEEIHDEEDFILCTLGEMSIDQTLSSWASENPALSEMLSGSSFGSFCHVYNALSSLDNPLSFVGRYDYLNNIFCSLSKDVDTNSYNDCQDNIYIRSYIADNMLKNYQLDKNPKIKLPSSMANGVVSFQDVKQKEQFGGGSMLKPDAGVLQKHSRKSKDCLVKKHGKSPKPRRRSGSDGKQSRHRSNKHNKRGHAHHSRQNSGGSDRCDGHSMDSAGSGGDGNGNGGDDDEKERKRRGGPEKIPVEDDEEEAGEDESEDENVEEEITGDVGNLQRGFSVEHEKSLDKDLTNLLSDEHLPCPAEPEDGKFSERLLDTDAFISTSEAPIQDLSRDIESHHAHISMDTLCDTIGRASSKDYVPNDELFFPVNLCMSKLTHNVMQAFTVDCDYCSILLEMLKHMAKCSSSAVCYPCTQGYNMIWHHTRICIQNGRHRTPYSRTDLCFKLCQNVMWDIEWLNINTTDNKMTIKKCCNRILALTCEDVEEPITESSSLGPQPSPDPEPNRPVNSQNGLRKVGLSRKPSSTRRSIPPSISEREEDEKEEQKDKSKDNNKEDSAIQLLKQNYARKQEESFEYVDRDYISSMPQGGNINDQLQFNSFVNRPKGVKGVGEVVYSSVQQLRHVAGFWEKKKEDFKMSGTRPFQRAEEGVILEKYQHRFTILGTRYQLDFQWHKLTTLGSGMTGRCYLALDKTTNFTFCVKKINLVDYKKEELCLWSDLEHPHIVTLYGALRHSDTIYLFTEYIDGGDLLHCIEEHKSGGERLSHWLALKYFQQLLQVLSYLESKNLLHEDIKADNILLRAESFQVVLTDFGLCHRLQKPVELKNKAPAGTATHFSPEKAASLGHGIPACVWACVCVLVHMLSGQQPWHKYLKKVDYLNFTIFMKPPPLDDVPDNIRAIVKDLIAQGFTKDPEQRPTARQLLEHEAFNILNLETETHISHLYSGLGQQISGANSNRGCAVVKHIESTGENNEEEQEVSLYKISLPHHSVVEIQRSVDAHNIQNHALESGNAAVAVEMTMNLVGEKTSPSEESELEGAVGGEVERQVDPPKDAVMHNRKIDTGRRQHPPEIQQMINPILPDLATLLASSEEPIRSFLTDTNKSVQLEITQEQLVVYNPVPSGSSDQQLPNLSIFDIDNIYSWDKDISPSTKVQCSRPRLDESYLSSGDLDSAELLATGTESSANSGETTTSYIDKKPRDLKLDVTQVRLPVRHQSSLDKSSNSKKSTTGTTSSSLASSVFFTGSASKTGDDLWLEIEAAASKRRMNLVEDDEGNDNMVDVDKKKIRNAIQSWKSDHEDTSDGHRLSLYNEDSELLFLFGIQQKDLRKAYKHHISEFKGQIFKLGVRHFELTNMEGVLINYNACPHDMHLKVMPKEEKWQCFCAGCQF